jgi:uncharacterized protein HemX
MKLQEQRMRLEIQSRAGKSPMKAIIGVTVLLLGIGGVVLYKVQAANKAEIAERERRAEQDRVANAAARAELEKRLAAITHDMEARLKAAKTDAERQQIRLEAQLATRQAAEERQAKTPRKSRGGGAAASDAPKPSAPRVPGKRDINDDILGGL